MYIWIYFYIENLFWLNCGCFCYGCCCFSVVAVASSVVVANVVAVAVVSVAVVASNISIVLIVSINELLISFNIGFNVTL